MSYGVLTNGIIIVDEEEFRDDREMTVFMTGSDGLEIKMHWLPWRKNGNRS